jgi:hypothetical protein
MELLQERGGNIRLEHAVFAAQEALPVSVAGRAHGDFAPNIGVTPQRVNPNVPAQPAYVPPLFGRESIPTSAEREAEARGDAAREDRLRRAWELFSKETQAMHVDPHTAARAMEYQAQHQCSWPEALRAVGETEFTEQDLADVQKLMKNEPNLKWNQAYYRVKGRYPD